MDEQREGTGPSAMISTSAVQPLHEYTGRGPTKAKTLINEDRCDRAARGHPHHGRAEAGRHGRSDRVLQLRHDYQLIMRDELVGIVERQLHRKVIAFMSQNHIDPDLAVEVLCSNPPMRSSH